MNRSRIFGRSEVEPQPESLTAQVEALTAGELLDVRFHGDDEGWFRAEFAVADGLLRIERFLATEDGIRDTLNTWAAWLETQEGNPHVQQLMQHMIATQQLFTCESHSDNRSPLVHDISRWLADRTDGVFQVDDHGFFDIDGALMVAEVNEKTPS